MAYFIDWSPMIFQKERNILEPRDETSSDIDHTGKRVL
jgi:hypothetical protein